MDWLKLPLAVLRSEPFIDADPTQRATWLSLLGYCADAENGGRIPNCRDWKCRKWQQLAGVLREEVHRSAHGLYTWDDQDLVVGFYPHEQEAMVRASRENGRKGGRPRNPPVTPPDNQGGNPFDDLGKTEQSRAEESRLDQSRAEQIDTAPLRPSPACPQKKPPSLDDLYDFIDSQNGSIPDHPRARSHAREFHQEMTQRRWHTADGARVRNGLALFIDQLRRDRILQ